MWVTLSGAQLPIAVKWISALAASTSTQHRLYFDGSLAQCFLVQIADIASCQEVFFLQKERRQSSNHQCWSAMLMSRSLVKVISEHLPSEWPFWKSTWSYPIKDILTRYLKVSSGILIISYPCFFQGALWSPEVGGASNTGGVVLSASAKIVSVGARTRWKCLFWGADVP